MSISVCLYLELNTKPSFRTGFSDLDIASVWLKSARLFRKNGHIGPAYNAVMHAAQLKAKSATIEHSRLMWRDGHHRKAIQTLKGAIAANAFVAEESETSVRASVSMTGDKPTQNILAAKVSAWCIMRIILRNCWHQAVFVNKRLGSIIACKMDRSSWADSLGDYCPELSGGDPALQQVSNAYLWIFYINILTMTQVGKGTFLLRKAL